MIHQVGNGVFNKMYSLVCNQVEMAPKLVKMHLCINLVVVVVTMLVLKAMAPTRLVTKLVVTNIYLMFAYHPMGLMGPTKSNPHFVNGFDGNVVTNFAMPILVKFLIFSHS
jgi:hypothetical protein